MFFFGVGLKQIEAHKGPYPATLPDVIERSLSGGRESEELIAVTLLLCLCRSSFIRLKGLKQAVRAHLLLHIKPSLPYLHYRKCMHRWLLRGFGNRNMSNKVALLRWSEEIWLQALENQPRRFKPSLNCLNSPTQLWNEHKFHPRLVCLAWERGNGKCWRFQASNKIRKGIKLQSWKCAAASECPLLHTEKRYLTGLQTRLLRISDQKTTHLRSNSIYGLSLFPAFNNCDLHVEVSFLYKDKKK